MTATREAADVLISGAGPSGLVTALLLAKLGVRSIVIERNAFTDEHPKAHELNTRSVEVLREIGVTEEDLSQEASPLEDGSRVLFCRTIGEDFGKIDLLDTEERRAKYRKHLRQSLPYFNLSQSEFEKILVARVRASSLIDLRFRHKWNGLIENDETTVVSGVVDEGNGNAYEIEAKYLLACDGAGSPVRRALGIAVDGPAEIQNFVGAHFKLNLRPYLKTPAKLFFIAHPKYAGSFIAHHIEKRWVFMIPYYPPWQKPEDFTEEFFKERIRGAVGADLPELEIASISPWRMSAQVAQQYSKGRAYLIGDAAHRFPPTGGLGMNTGIADAHNLAWKIAAVLNGKADDELLGSYESERRPVAIKNCEESRVNYEKILEVFLPLGYDLQGLEKLARLMASFPMRVLPESWKRAFISLLSSVVDRKLKRVFTDPNLRAETDRIVEQQRGHFDRLGLDIGYTYEKGALVDDGSPVEVAENEISDYIPSTRPGARLPHAWVETPEGRKSTHDFVAYDRFTLFVDAERQGTPPASFGDAVQVVDVSEWENLPGDWKHSLLVRPDGHIAWRGDRWDSAHLDHIMFGQRSPLALPGEVST